MSEAQNGGNVMADVNCLRCNLSDEDNGNCTAVGGFCTAVPAAHCPLLRQYLDTGMTPEAFQSYVVFLQDLIGDQKASEALDRFRQLVKADKDGRVVALPCKVGDTVYYWDGCQIIDYKVESFSVFDENVWLMYGVHREKRNGIVFGREFWAHEFYYCKTVFLTREEAKKALEAMKDE